MADGTYSYTVSAVCNGEEGGQSDAATVEIVRIEKLNGIVIGTSGSWNNNVSTTRTAVFDGDLTTYFDALQSNGAWAGIDLGADNEAVVTEIRYCPHRGFASRMNGGTLSGFQYVYLYECSHPLYNYRRTCRGNTNFLHSQYFYSLPLPYAI